MSLQKLLTALFIGLVFTCKAGNEKYRLILTDNPSSTIMIGWNQTSGDSPIIYYGTQDFGTDWQSYPMQKSVDRKVSYKAMNNHFAKLSNLKANTAYYFVIKDLQGVSRRFWFKTAPDTNSKMSFIAGGDSRNNRDVRQNANRLVAKLKPHAVFFGGDMTNLDTLFEWKDWFNDWQLTIAPDGRMFPIIPARGNHEQSNKVIYNLFNTPSTDIYYALTFGKNLVRSYTLNSEITAGGNQVNWLQNDLKNHEDIVWKMAQYHKPMRPHVSSKSEGNDQYNNWSQLFYDYGVRLVCESDSHSVKSTWPVKPCSGANGCDQGFVKDTINGTVYVGEGCWGAPLRANDDKKSWTRDSASFNQFKLIFVDTFKMEVRTIVVGDSRNIQEVPNNNVFELPKNLQVWKPSNGEVVELFNPKLQNSKPDIVFGGLTNEQVVSTTEATSIKVINKKINVGIAAVEFKVNGQSVKVDTTFPYELEYTFSIGRNKVEATAYNLDYSAYDVEQLYVNAGNYAATASSSIITSKDDVEEGIDADGKLYYDSSDLEMSFDYGWTWFGTNQYVGLRFQNIKVPKGAAITEAYIQFVAVDSQSNAVHLRIATNDTSNANEFGTAYAVSKRKRLANPVSWRPSRWRRGDLGTHTKSPNLSNHIQQLVTKQDWNYGNSISFVIWENDHSKSRRKAYTFDNDPSKAAKLVVKYSFGATTMRRPISKNAPLIVKEITEKVQLKKENKYLLPETKVYPNPFSNRIIVDLGKDSQSPIELLLYDINGKLLWRKPYEAREKTITIDTQNIAEGKYLLQIYNVTTQKITAKQLIK
ncbi:conserved protein of unknown function precursor containing a type A C-terminal secretion signal [Tenacibaculum sp. 190524A02b]|uniref:fibronectin type III domain-containing protein n=1 Tax=Tenacibaculum vairaonense TaxID=3137860 RepID=UPI0032B26C5D